MRYLFTLLVSFTFSIPVLSQQMSTDEWKELSKSDSRLLPKYGHIPKTEEEKEKDERFIKAIMEQDQFEGSRKVASDHLIDLGFQYLYRGDQKTAMYRFNQAYLLDSTNTDIYWGYGAFFLSIGYNTEAASQYQKGLSIDPNSTHLLTDYGTYYMGQYYTLNNLGLANAPSRLDSAIFYIDKSLQLDPKDVNTLYKLSICYWLKGDCDKARKYLALCNKEGGQPITKEYLADLEASCP